MTKLHKYITITLYGCAGESDSTFAFRKDEAWRTFLKENDWADYIWQLAPSKAEAIKQHDKKVDQWQNDIDAGRKPKKFY